MTVDSGGSQAGAESGGDDKCCARYADTGPTVILHLPHKLHSITGISP